MKRHKWGKEIRIGRCHYRQTCEVCGATRAIFYHGRTEIKHKPSKECKLAEQAKERI